ncbi:MAG: hypothetical protein KVP17_002849 [Porospora cf. gigantea B]|uniref:uncharacterized protein n=1 Tax=Porospora cf. gigantea B TaxID=2853592 RepID=UPI003571CDAE|nr:MAG: hypothetical protein KVP17_002849 [Porospora cf. gigantea B]
MQQVKSGIPAEKRRPAENPRADSRTILIRRHMKEVNGKLPSRVHGIPVHRTQSQVLGRFEETSNLGSGTYAEVFKIRDKGELKAGKVLGLDKFNHSHFPRVTSMMISEIENLAKCQCQNVVGLHAVIVNKEQVLLVQELVANGPLWPAKKLDLSLAFNYFVQLLQAILFMQEQGIVHRDLKPTNILASSDGWLKVCDFGWSEEEAKLRDGPREWPGTLEINPPEIIDYRRHDCSRKIDNYALGMNMLYLFYGKFVCRPKGSSGLDAAKKIFEAVEGLRNGAVLKGFTRDAWKVFLGLTEPDSEVRWSIEDVIYSPWFTERMARVASRCRVGKCHIFARIWHPRILSLVSEHSANLRTLSVSTGMGSSSTFNEAEAFRETTTESWESQTRKPPGKKRPLYYCLNGSL